MWWLSPTGIPYAFLRDSKKERDGARARSQGLRITLLTSSKQQASGVEFTSCSCAFPPYQDFWVSSNLDLHPGDGTPPRVHITLLMVTRGLWLRKGSLLWVHMCPMAIPLASQSSDWASCAKEISAPHSQHSCFSNKLHMLIAALMCCACLKTPQSANCKRIR